MAEAYPLRKGLFLAQHIGCTKFIIQSDNMQVIETMLGDGFSATQAAAIFYDCRILTSGFTKVCFEHCPREANMVAQELTRNSFRSKLSCFWDDDPPSFILPMLINGVLRNYF